MKKKVQEEVVPSGHQIKKIDIEELRLKKLIELFEPLYTLSDTKQMKSLYGSYLNDLKLDLEKKIKK